MIRFLHRVRLSVWRIVDPIEKLSSRNNCTHLFIALEAFNDELANFPYKIAAIPAEQVPKMQFMNHDLSARGQLLLLVFGRHTQKTSIGYTRCCCRRVSVISHAFRRSPNRMCNATVQASIHCNVSRCVCARGERSISLFSGVWCVEWC